MSHAIARAFSILGHPMLVLPLAALVLALLRGQQVLALWMGVGFATFAAVVMAYSNWQVRRGRWAHVDASGKAERTSLNRFLLLLLSASTLVAATTAISHELTLGLALSAAMVAIAMSTARWWKLSLHMAFAVFAALLLWHVSWQAGVGGLLFAAAVAWSRLRLQRHVPRDLVAGAFAGTAAGGLFMLLVAKAAS